MATPEIVPYTYREFFRDELRLRRHGFEEVEEWSDDIVFQSPEANNFLVKVRTGCDRKKVEECRRLSLFSVNEIVNLPIGRDMACVAIIDMRIGVEVYSRVVYRTRTFRKDFFKRIWITWLKILDPPLCPECKIRMEICKRRRNRQTWWGCLNDGMHSEHEPHWVPWDAMLPDKALQFVREMRDERRDRESVGHAGR